MNQVPVVGDSGHLIGIVTRGDLLKVFMRTDREIAADATAAIRGVLNEPEAVTVTVTDGIMSLQGELASQLEAEAAEAAAAAAAAVPGVVAVDANVRALI